jgi:hypothetical protein
LVAVLDPPLTCARPRISEGATLLTRLATKLREKCGLSSALFEFGWFSAKLSL